MPKKRMKSEGTEKEKTSEQTTGGVKWMNDEELTGIVGGNGNDGNNTPPLTPPPPIDNTDSNEQEDTARVLPFFGP